MFKHIKYKCMFVTLSIHAYVYSLMHLYLNSYLIIKIKSIYFHVRILCTGAF